MNKIKAIAMHWVSSAAMFSAVLVANFGCSWIFYQEKEPESVRKLRKF